MPENDNGRSTGFWDINTCDECGREGLDPEKDLCGCWIGVPGRGYACPDLICEDCRNPGDDADERIRGDSNGL
jgi:hypothetical protein